MIRNEELLADALKERVEADMDMPYGIAEFCYDDIEIDSDTIVEVEGWTEYTTGYDDSCNYHYYSYLSIDICRIEGIKADGRKVAQLLKEKLLYG